MNIDILNESKCGFRQNASARNLGRHNRQLKDVRIKHLASDCNTLSGLTFSQIQTEIFFKLNLFKQHCWKKKRDFLIIRSKVGGFLSLTVDGNEYFVG